MRVKRLYIEGKYGGISVIYPEGERLLFNGKITANRSVTSVTDATWRATSHL